METSLQRSDDASLFAKKVLEVTGVSLTYTLTIILQ